jgi:hypothetical protein
MVVSPNSVTWPEHNQIERVVSEPKKNVEAMKWKIIYE